MKIKNQENDENKTSSYWKSTKFMSYAKCKRHIYYDILIKLKHYWNTTFPPLYVFFFRSLEHRTSEDRLKSVGGRSNGTALFFEEITFCSDSFSPFSCPWFCMGVCSDSLPCVGGSPGYIRVAEITTVILWFRISRLSIVA